MSVYVDEAMHPFGRMMMCHMIADTRDELLAMVDKIGVQRKWIQKKDTPDEHFDICMSKRAKAIAQGAKAVDGHEIVRVIRLKRERTAGGDPRRLRCDKCLDLSVLYGPVGLGEQHEDCGGFYRLVDLRNIA